MLARKYKIGHDARIEEVKTRGKIFQSDNFGVRVVKRDDTELPNFAFVISTKISKLAVQRNRIARALNEGVRRSLAKIPKGRDLVFLTKKRIATKTTEEIIKEVEKFFREKNLND